MGDDTAAMNRRWGALIVEELLRCGVNRFVLSPGSRCTPLTLAVADAARAKVTIHFDERGAAYFALGQARVLQRPVALVCTSGTAAANYFPAVVEAAQSQVPLILLTADRPPELLDCGANQTIDHNRLFGTYVRSFHALPCPDAAIGPEVVLTTIDQAVHRARHAPAGPVHINCPYREPFVSAGRLSEDPFHGLPGLANWRQGGKPFTTYARGAQTIDDDDERFLADLVYGAKRGVLLVGQVNDAKTRDAVLRLGASLDWPVIADVTSGLRVGGYGAPLLHYADLMVLSPALRGRFRPDMVFHFGGAVTSKRIVQHLEAHPPEHYVRVASHPLRHDPIHRVTLRIEADEASFCVGLASRCRGTANPEWRQALVNANAAVDKAIEAYLRGEADLTEPAVARCISERLSEDDALFLGNSMPIRDMDMVGSAVGPRPRVYANRGASGIDGNIATAAGISLGSDAPVTAILGDLAVLHDLNSLTLLRNPDIRVCLVIVNNNGGGIFHFLPISEHSTHFERFFGTPHGLQFQKAAEQFGLDYACPGDQDSFLAAYDAARNRNASSIIEVTTDREANLRVHRAMQQTVAEVVDRSLAD